MAQAKRFKPFETKKVQERALLVGIDFGKSTWTVDESLDELERLVDTDGAQVVARLTQKLEKPIPKTCIGSGKVEELIRMVHALDIDVVIFDEELTPSQQSNLEKLVGEPTKIIDRTALILDIFGEHARTREGRLQVQLAQLQYLLSRLRGMWSHLLGEQTRGGIGSRFGQGESQLEVDRRMIRARISHLKAELDKIETRRDVKSKRRWEQTDIKISLVGYTNAGKSTLINTLTNSSVYAQDKLFATLDATTRALVLDEGRKFTITDTVGFIQKLPTLLIESFKSTLVEVKAADLLLLVADAHDPHLELELQAVKEVLKDLDCEETPYILVLNKVDLLDADQYMQLKEHYPDAIFISALESKGLEELKFAISQKASENLETIHIQLPYTESLLMRMVHEQAQIIHEAYEDAYLSATIKVTPKLLAYLKNFIVEA